ncbi:MAG: sel1 repeat family protein [Erysipelotrichales bacterium]|nr:sel1 repeat family protein [Erysipelotrichales bacterium]
MKIVCKTINEFIENSKKYGLYDDIDFDDKKKYMELIKYCKENAHKNSDLFVILGKLYFNKNFFVNYKKATEWYMKAAEYDNVTAQIYLGICYENGLGVTKDYKRASEWYLKAAEKGDATAQFYLGECYHYGYGVNKDKKQAIEWYTKAAEQGDFDALAKLHYYKHFKRSEDNN